MRLMNLLLATILLGCGPEQAEPIDEETEEGEFEGSSERREAPKAGAAPVSQKRSANVTIEATEEEPDEEEVEEPKEEQEPKMKVIVRSTQTKKQSRISFKGYIGGVFEVKVDGETYADMEDFYTKELQALPKKIEESGLKGNYRIKFDAQIGYSDLWRNMNVYMAPNSDRGYQGQARVRRDGGFTINFPADAEDDTYRVRATKRISVLVSGEGVTKRFCYNFSAEEQSVSVDSREKPIILREFKTNLTSYACGITKNRATGIVFNSKQPMKKAAPVNCSGSSCSTPKEALLDFKQSESLVPENCKVSKMKPFVEGENLRIFMLAKCTAKTELFSLKASVEGEASETTTRVSECANDVMSFGVDKGPDGYLVAYRCKIDSGNSSIGIKLMGQNDTLGDEKLYANVDSRAFYQNIDISWNETGSAFTLAGLDLIQRFDSKGQELGGRIEARMPSIKSTRVASGHWNFLAGSSSLSTYCSRLDDKGNLLHNRQYLGYGKFRFLGDESLVQTSTTGYLYLYKFLPESCKSERIARMGRLPSGKPGDVFDAITWKEDYGLLFYRTRTAISIATFKLSGENSKMLATTSIANFTNQSGIAARSFQMNGKVAIVYSVDGRLHVGVSQQSATE